VTTIELPDAEERPTDLGPLEWKALPTGETSSPLTGVIGFDDKEGTITAIVAVSGVPDKVGDVIVPGSLGTAIKRLKPKGVVDHNWAAKVSKMEYGAELMPGDPRLPKTTPSGQPWPANAGGLLIKARYNLDKQAGRDAYADAKFYGPEECFSIGYKVRPGGAKMRRGLRHLIDYDIYEYSQVLHGAHDLATLTGVKSLTDGVDWYPDGRSGNTAPVEGTIEVKAIGGRRVVRNAQFWGLPIGTPIKPGMKPRGRNHAATPEEIDQTTAPEAGGAPHAGGAAPPAGPKAAAGVAPVPQTSSPGVLKALAALHSLYQQYAALQNDSSGGHSSVVTAANMHMLSQFAAPGAEVHASPDGAIAALNNGDVWVVIDTANGGSLHPAGGMLSSDIPGSQVDGALRQLSELDIPWDDAAARRKRWENAKTKTADRAAVQDILGKLTPFDTSNAGAQQARYDAEGAISDGNRDDLADALTRMGLPPDQDPHDTAATLLVLPSDVVKQRLDAIQTASDTGQPPQAPGMADQAGVPAAPADTEARYAAQRAAAGVPDDHSDIAPIPGGQVGAPKPAAPYAPKGNMATAAKLTDTELDIEHQAAVDRYRHAHTSGVPRNTSAYTDARTAAQVFGDEKRKRTTARDQAQADAINEAHATDQGTATPKTPKDAPTTPESTPDEHGLIEGPDGELELSEDAVARQDRVEKLLDAGDTAVRHQSSVQLGDDRKDLVAELGLQEELARRDTARKAEAAAARGAAPNEPGEGADAGGDGGADTVDQPTDSAPKLRPGLAGAAEDLGDALNATPRDDDAVKTAADRLAKLLRKAPEGSAAFDDIHKVIGDGDLHAAIAAGTLKPGMLFAAAAALREERRVKRNEGARKRRAAKRIERDRIRSLIGAIDTELRNRGVNPDDYGGAVDGLSAGPDSVGSPGSSASTTAPTKSETPAPTTPAPESSRARTNQLNTAAASAGGLGGAGSRRVENGSVHHVFSEEDPADPSAVAEAVRGLGWDGVTVTDKGKPPNLDTNRHLIEVRIPDQGAQSEGDHEPTGPAGAAVVPAVPTAGVSGDSRQANVLREPGGAGSPGDRAGGDRASGGRPAGRNLPGQDRPASGGAAGGDRTGDAPNAAGPAAPGLAGQRLPDGGDTGPEHAPDTQRGRREAGGGDAGVQRRPQRTGPAESSRGEGSDAGTAPAAEPGLTQPVTTADRDAATGADDVPENTPELPDEQPAVDRAQLDAIPETGDNFRPVNVEDFAPAGKKAKLEANLAALRVLRQLQAERRPATPEEQATLARWAGWGGLPEVFDDHKPEYAAQREQLRGLLDDKEWAEARRNTLNAHYTDATAVAAIWKAVQDLGFDGGRVLEPGSGSGTFIGFAPEQVDMIGVELDSTTAAISRALYPNATIRNESFADTRLPAGSMDAVVGNVPFGDFALTDRVHNPGRKHSIHNHFIIKSLAATKPGGICALLTSRYTLDSHGAAARKQMAEMGDLVGAVRLPTGSHSRTAGTDVIEDILIFRRREPGADPLTSQDWVTSHKQDINGFQIEVNDYFTNHPGNVLGEATAEAGRYGSGSLIVKGNGDLADTLPAALERITEAARTGGVMASERLQAPAAIAESLDTHDGYIGTDADGNFAQAVGGAMVPFDVPAKQAEELRGLISLRDTLRALLDAESKSVTNSPEIRQLRAALNDQYDAYVARFGPINRYTLSKTGSRVTPGQGGFRRDPMSAIVRALEVYDPETGTAAKTNIFTKRAVAPREIPTTADNPADAIALSMDTYGEINLPAIARMLDIDEPTAREQLISAGLAFEQPPLTTAEQNAAWEAHIESPELGDSGASAPDLSSVGESVRESGRLEPAAAYLSGNVRRKLAAAAAAAEHDPRFTANVDALKAVIPPDLGVDEVDGRLGAAWIPAEDVKAFLVDLIHDGDDSYGSVKVATSGGGIWTVSGADYGQRATEQWGTNRVSAGEIVQALLEQRSIRVTDTIDGKSYPNLEDTAAAQAKAEEISERFSEWLWEDSDRTRRLLANYNNQFNAIRLRSYDDVERAFPGMAENFTPRPHQVAAVNRMVSEPCALLAHVVGAGKTAEMAMGTAELKRLGLARKPAIVIPNHMLEQFSREYLQIYPNAKILAAGTDDLKGDARREFVARAATGEWDCVILTQNAMQLIPMSRAAMEAYIDREMATMRAQLERAKADAAATNDTAKANTVKKMEKAVVKAEEALKAKLDKQKDAGVTFEQTGIDYVCVDEAHMYSNLRTLSNIQGAGATGSDMASDLHMKLEHLRANNASGRVATFATGTPIRNTVTQAYIMQRYMRPDLLEEAGIHSFDQWAATFGQTVEEMELKPEGAGFRQTTRFAKFRNVPELLRLFRIFADVKMADDLNLPTPELEGGAVQNVTVPASEELKAFIRELGDRAEDVRRNSPQMRPSASGGDDVEDNMLLVSTDGRKAALSMAMVGGEHQPGKIEAAADNIARIWQATKDRPVPCDINDPAGGDCPPPGGMQIVFCDMGTPGSSTLDAYAMLRDQLAERGMDPSSIRFMHEARNDREKAELFAAARNGQVSVLVGSTEKMGVGTNVQRRAVAMHHLDAPWRPSDVEQRDGRIMRQGNTNATVGIYRYVTAGSFDAYMWQTLERKAKFINQIMKGSLDAREIEDVGDTALSYAEVKAIATGNPLLLDKAKADTTVSKLSRLERQHGRTQTNLKRDIVAYDANAKEADRQGNLYGAAIAKRTDVSGDKFAMVVAGRKLTDRTTAATALRDRMQEALSNYSPYYSRSREPQYLGSFGGHDLYGRVEQFVGRGGNTKLGMTLSWDEMPGTIETLDRDRIDNLGPGVFITLANNLAGFESRRDLQRDRARHLRDEIEVMKGRIGLPFAKADELKAAQAEQARLEQAMASLGLDSATGPAVDQSLATLANARAAAGRTAGHMGRSGGDAQQTLKRFANPAASGKAYVDAGGALAAMGSGKALKVFTTTDGNPVLRPDGVPDGIIDDPQALLDDLATLDFPWDRGSSAIYRQWDAPYVPPDYTKSYEQREREREEAQAQRERAREAAMAKLRAIWAKHTVKPDAAAEAARSGLDRAKAVEEKSMDAVIPAAELDRARALGVEVKADTAESGAAEPDDESYEDVVAADDRYVMDASGVLLKAVMCPTCGNQTQYPVSLGQDTRTCLMCGTSLQMQPTPATVG
jgi:N12 class adenine-specific DNA methylase